MTAFTSLSQSNISSTSSSYDTISANDLFSISEPNYFKQAIERRSYVSQKIHERSSQKYFVRKLRQGGASIQEQQLILEKIEQRRRRDQLNDTDNSTSESDSDHDNNSTNNIVNSKLSKKQSHQKKQLSKEKSDDSGFSSSSSTNNNNTKKSLQKGDRSNKRADRRRNTKDDLSNSDSQLDTDEQSDSDIGSDDEKRQTEEDNEIKLAGDLDERIRFKRNLNFQTDDMQAMSGQVKLGSNDWKHIIEEKLDQQSLIRLHIIQNTDKRSKKGKGSKSKNICY